VLDIFICEDDIGFQEYVRKTIEDYVFINNISMRVACAAANPAEILAYLNENPRTSGLYFLDVHLGCEMDGITLANEIRKFDARGFIVFITSDAKSNELIFQYFVEAMGFIVKSDANIDQRICQCIDKVRERLSALPNKLKDNMMIKLADDSDREWKRLRLEKNSHVTIDCESIICIAPNPDVKHTVVIHTTDGVLEYRSSLTDIMAQLDKTRFFRCQNNLIVNLYRIVNIDAVHRKIMFDSKLEVAIPYPKIKILREKLDNNGIKLDI